MSELLSTGFSSGGSITRSIITGSIGSGASGDILDVSPPAGRKITLLHLSTFDLLAETGISVGFGGTVFVTATINGSDPTIGNFSVGSYQPYAGTLPPVGNVQSVSGDTDESLVISKGVGSTGTTIYFAYEFGE